MPDNRCVVCQEAPCVCADLDETIRQVADSGASGYVATKHGPMNAAACRVLALLSDPASVHPVTVWQTEWLQVAKLDGLDDYRIGASIEGGETAPWRMRDGLRDVSFHMDELRELHGLLGRIIDGEAGQPAPELR